MLRHELQLRVSEAGVAGCEWGTGGSEFKVCGLDTVQFSAQVRGRCCGTSFSCCDVVVAMLWLCSTNQPPPTSRPTAKPPQRLQDHLPHLDARLSREVPPDLRREYRTCCFWFLFLGFQPYSTFKPLMVSNMRAVGPPQFQLASGPWRLRSLRDSSSRAPHPPLSPHRPHPGGPAALPRLVAAPHY